MKQTQALLPLSLLAFQLPTASAFWRLACGISQTARMDPILTPGTIGGHMHKFAGGINVNIDSDYDSLQASSCSSCEVQKDKSAYWTPDLYYQHADGTFVEVPNDGMTVYYLGRVAGGSGSATTAFPKGFKMIAGDSRLRSYDTTTLTYKNVRPIADQVSFRCINAANNLPETHGIEQTDCANGLRAQINFPTCWNGRDLYLPDQSHVAHLSSIDNGDCPPTHPVAIPHLFYEVNYGVNDIDQSDGGRFVFANGDTTGYGFHGDFVNGWDPDVLRRAIDQCLYPDLNGVARNCPPLLESQTNDFPRVCPERPSVINERRNGTVVSPLTSLPGCNPVTSGPASVPQVVCPVNSSTPTTSSSISSSVATSLSTMTSSISSTASTNSTSATSSLSSTSFSSMSLTTQSSSVTSTGGTVTLPTLSPPTASSTSSSSLSSSLSTTSSSTSSLSSSSTSSDSLSSSLPITSSSTSSLSSSSTSSRSLIPDDPITTTLSTATTSVSSTGSSSTTAESSSSTSSLSSTSDSATTTITSSLTTTAATSSTSDVTTSTTASVTSGVSSSDTPTTSSSASSSEASTTSGSSSSSSSSTESTTNGSSSTSEDVTTTTSSSLTTTSSSSATGPASTSVTTTSADATSTTTVSEATTSTTPTVTSTTATITTSGTTTIPPVTTSMTTSTSTTSDVLTGSTTATTWTWIIAGRTFYFTWGGSFAKRSEPTAPPAPVFGGDTTTTLRIKGREFVHIF